MGLNDISIKKWFIDKGDQTLMLDHNLDNNSVVVDIGAYTGEWISIMSKKYKCNYYALEPVKKFYDIIEEKFKNNPKIRCLMNGMSSKNEIKLINISADGSSVFGNSNEKQSINLLDIETFMKLNNLEKIDLLQMNVEGMEYEILKSWIENSNILSKINKILIQFHEVDDLDVIKEREYIQTSLLENKFKKCFDYFFVWECWEQ